MDEHFPRDQLCSENRWQHIGQTTFDRIRHGLCRKRAFRQMSALKQKHQRFCRRWTQHPQICGIGAHQGLGEGFSVDSAQTVLFLLSRGEARCRRVRQPTLQKCNLRGMLLQKDARAVGKGLARSSSHRPFGTLHAISRVTRAKPSRISTDARH